MLLSKLQIKKTKKIDTSVRAEPIDVREYLFSKMKIEVLSWLDNARGEIISTINKLVKQEITDIRQTIKKGDKGDKGNDSFIPGPIGPRGPEGKSVIGPRGPEGKASTVPGPKGDKGDKGEDGSPDKPEEIATKLNTLENAIDMKVIIGLQEMFANIQRVFNRREKGGGLSGGGMGNWEHQRTAISSITTTVTLSYNVAAGGLAHIARYNGQVIDLDTDYSINGKTITLLFTPDDGTIFSIAYVRT